MTTPLISVIIPAFNAAETLGEAVQSVVRGTYQNFEILIADDVSADDTPGIAEKMTRDDARIQFFRNKQNLGVCKTRNMLSGRARGKYLAFLDSDDTWEPNKLEVCLDLFARYPEIRAVGHALRYLTSNGKQIGYIPARPCSYEELEKIKNGGDLPHVYPSSVVMERSLFLEEGGFAEDWPVGEDTEFFARVAWHSGLLVTSKPLGSYRLKSGSLTEKYWLKKRLSDRCVRENFRRIKRGESPVSIIEYEREFLRNIYINPTKLGLLRRLLSRHMLRRAGEMWLCGNRIRSSLFGICGVALAPLMAVSRMRSRGVAHKKYRDPETE